MNDIPTSQTFEEIRRERIAKADALKAAGGVLYPAQCKRTHTLADTRASFDTLTEAQQAITVAGRILSVREHGGSTFIDIYDGTATLQGFLKRDTLGDESYTLFASSTDRGDFVELSGTTFTTKRGELSLLADSWRMLAKSLRPIPSEHFGIKDEDERYRRRYLDILLTRELHARILRRSLFWNTARTFLLNRSFVEVETPILETLPGGAEAKPFTTHHNALDIDVHLRISVGELWQKKLMVAGLPKTFEIGRVFRNEGMSAEHAQDYTSMEFYEAYNDITGGMKMVRELYLALANTVYGTTTFTARGHTFNLAEEWQVYDFCALLSDAYGFDARTAPDDAILGALKKSGIAFDEAKPMTKERAVDTLWKKIRSQLGGPGFLVNVPVYLEPLAKRSAQDERVVERFQVILAGSEVGKGFSELNDPRDQAERFQRQEEMRLGGDDEAQHADVEFIEAMEYGMPPCFGFGVSERLFSFFEGVSVREAQIFPLMRPR